MQDKIVIKGAREHNLKDISLEIPRNSLTVITGLSGSGKSTLAFDTIYAEGQRRYVESLSAYARQFIGVMNKPDVDSIEGLSPAISIEQKTTSRNPRSTVGTVTEIYDYLRLLYARIGVPHCPKCKNKISVQTTEQIANAVLAHTDADFAASLREGGERTKIPDASWKNIEVKDKRGEGKQEKEGQKAKDVQVLSPIIRGKKGTYEKLFDELRRKGYSSVRLNGAMLELDREMPKLDKNKRHTIEVIVDKFTASNQNRQRLLEAIKAGIRESGDGLVIVAIGKERELLFSQKNSCPDCGISVGELQPRMFSFNSPYGMCSDCSGMGVQLIFDVDLVVPDKTRTLREGAILPWRNTMMGGYYSQLLSGVAKKYGFSMDTQWNVLSKEAKSAILNGTGEKIAYRIESRSGESAYEGNSKFEGVLNNLKRLHGQTASEYRRVELEKYMRELTCPSCKGKRLKPEVLAVKVNGKDITESTELSIESSYGFFNSLKLTKTEETIAKPVLREILSRLDFLMNVGVGYLSLARVTGTLSGGEAQRIRLATQIGANLMGVLYVLDEPSIGLHQRDNAKLIATLKTLRDMGNTLIVVEHDEETMRSSDFMVDLGPGAGVHGGRIIAIGTPEEIENSKESLTGAYLRRELRIPVPGIRRNAQNWLSIIGARENNLKNITVKFPLGCITCITGVSGSGKSTLINEILHKALMKYFHNSKDAPGKFDRLEGAGKLREVVAIDQAPIGRTPRSNPATYIGAFTPIRELFAGVPEARARGYEPGQFSFNVQKGRCQACEGDGVKRIGMQFIADVYVTCEECDGKRYDAETLQIRFKGKNIHDVLSMSVEEALRFFQNIPAVKNKLETMSDVGLGYISIGQPATTLSGGEAQRIKLAAELSRRDTGSTLYILDEPTTGLHFADVSKLLSVLQRLVDRGNTVLVIEHNLDVIKTSDWIVDLGPEGGEDGGEVIATGTPEDLAKNKNSYTGEYLKKVL
ncbi:MAG: excinuclease ABC subunit UvrA [Candidatus Micrarchaeota archaeon]|nr:excinuclease ABC subunit UvrA [Candidatus Micrarchaeota archaeon]